MFLILAVVLVLLWLGGFFLLHVSSFLIHLLLLFALIAGVVPASATTYVRVEDAELEGYEPTVVHVDDRNRAITVGLGQAPGVYVDPEPTPVVA